MQQVRVENLFPTPIAFFNLSLTVEEKKFVRQLEQRPNDGNTTSKKNKILFEEPLKRIAYFVDQCLKEYVKQVYAPIHNVVPFVTQSWANYTKPGQFHHRHAHPNSFISGCVYIAANNDKIHFYREEYKQIKLVTENYNPYNSDSWWYEVNEGDVILFPSGLIHNVEPLSNDNDERISISFNTFLKGTIGDSERLTELLI